MLPDVMDSFSAVCLTKASPILFADKRVISAETFYHPMSKVWHSQDGGETTVMQGEWTTTHRGEPSHRRRRQLVHVVR